MLNLIVALLMASLAGSSSTLTPNEQFPGELVYSPSGEMLAAGRSSGPVKLYRRGPTGWTFIQALPASEPYHLVWGQTGNSLAWLEDNERLIVWRHGRITSFKGNDSSDSRHDVYSYAFSPDDSKLAVARLDGLQVIRLDSKKSTKYRSTSSAVTSVVFDKVGNLYAGGRTLLRLPHNASTIQEVGGVQGFVYGLAVSPDGRKLAVLEDVCKVEIYSLRPLGKHTVAWHGKGHPEEIVWSRLHNILAILTAANEKVGEPTSLNRVILLDPSTWKEQRSIPLNSSAFGGSSFDPSGSVFSSTDSGHNPVATYFWSVLSGKHAPAPQLGPKG
jgi:WD40 repeat protein